LQGANATPSRREGTLRLKRLVLKGEERETKTAASRHDAGPTDRLDLSASVDWQANLEKHP
jgi:hypothetical protein